MRKTLFKGKGLNGIWYKGNIIESSNGECYILQKNSNPIRKGSNGYWDINSPCFQVHPETVCQFTGLLDKNDCNILLFEGDLLSLDGIILGNKHETEVYKGKAHIVIPSITSKDWLSAYTFAVDRGFRHSK